MNIILKNIPPVWHVQCGIPFQVTICVTAITPGAVRICARLSGGPQSCRLAGAASDGICATVVITGGEEQCVTMTLIAECPAGAGAGLYTLDVTATRGTGETAHTSHNIHIDCA